MESLHPILTAIHSYNRYLILAALVFVLFRAYRGWLGNQAYDKTDNAGGGALLGLSHLQLLVGLIQYGFTSAYTKQAFQNFGAAMKDSWLRYFAVEHITMMLIAITLIQIGRIKSKKAETDLQKHKAMAIYTTIALLLILASLAPKGLLLNTLAGLSKVG